MLGLSAASCCNNDGRGLEVQIENGTIKGWMDEDILAFTNIPYIKFERFMPPEKADDWEGILECTTIPPKSMQSYRGEKPDSLDMCEEGATRLNVWTKNTKGSKPVMVWLHGGGFASGAGYANPNDSGRGLARQDVVFVSVNHRLDILGFLDLSACSEKYKYSGNVGMLDIVKALEWVRDNISAFGGDPDNVTIFGESGGGGKVGTLLCMPSAKGLFHKAAILSGTLLNQMKAEQSRAFGLATLEELGLAPNEVDRLSEIPYEELYKAGHAAIAKIAGVRRPGSAGFWGFGPTVEGDVLVQQPFQPGFADFSSDIPLMIGTTFNELQRTYYVQNPGLEEAKSILQETYGENTDAYVEAFIKAYPEYSTPADMLSVDRTFRPNTVRTLDARAAESKAPVYAYLFAWKSPIRDGAMGSAHAYELPFVFHTTEVAAQYLGEESDEIRRLADIMSAAWVSFAVSGKPQVDGLDWKPYTAEEGTTMYFNEECGLRYNHDRELITLIQSQ